ncbi:hypothetical protein PX617_003775 [Salmonella enterica subsp. enterica]|nr:hypothetical protein [Salmonella enterica subsp. enterica]
MQHYKKNIQRIIFFGQNSHGSNESWLYRIAFLKKIPKNTRAAIIIECPTIDLIIYLLKKMNYNKSQDFSFLLYSTYWWMRTVDFSFFLQSIPDSFSVFGIDVALSISHHQDHIQRLNSLTFPEKEILISLLKYDVKNDYIMSNISAEERENLMKEKISLVMKGDYELIFVVCHNFHAAKESWLHYPSLCQLLSHERNARFSLYSSAIFSNKMEFIATPDGSSLAVNRVNNVCNKINDNTWLVKMISSLYCSEEKDALNLIISTPRHFDNIIVCPIGRSIKMGAL